MTATAEPGAHVAGLLVLVRPDRLDEVARGLTVIPGADLHLCDRPGGRLVVTLDTPTLDGQQEGFRALAALPGVVAVNLVCHYTDAPVPARGVTR